MVRFWESSAITPLLVVEASTDLVRGLARDERQMRVWWGTEVECLSAISRIERQGTPARTVSIALQRLEEVADDWTEVAPTSAVREAAKRFLRVHPLRAGDAFQLAAAWTLSEGSPDSVEFVCLDKRLREAASREGFAVLPRSLRV